MKDEHLGLLFGFLVILLVVALVSDPDVKMIIEEIMKK